MSPFAEALKALRLRHGIRQKELAERVGYEQSYLAALEIGTKGPPTPEFIRRIQGAIDISEIELTVLRTSIQASRRRYSLPSDAPAEVFELFSELWDEIPNLSASQIVVIREVVRMRGTKRRATPLAATAGNSNESEVKM